MKKSILFLIMIIMSSVTLVLGLPSLNGPTGLISMPTAEILTITLKANVNCCLIKESLKRYRRAYRTKGLPLYPYGCLQTKKALQSLK